MGNEAVAILVKGGRLVSGHPMEEFPVTDNAGKAKLNALDEPRKSVNIGLAVPKNGGTDWKTTEWGRQLVAAAVAAWPNGEHGMPIFSYKVVDGDSTELNKKMKRPCDRDGYPGHWVVFASSELGPVRCHHVGKYQAHDVIQNKAEIKRGDYGTLHVLVKKNTGETPGMYVNPDFFVLDRPGEAIAGSETNVADVMAGMAGTGADNTQAAAGATTTPDEDFLAPPGDDTPPPPSGPVMTAKAAGKTYQSFIDNKWTHAQLVQHGYVEA